MTDFPAPKFVDAGGVKIATYEADGSSEGDGKPPIILVHGWPEIGFSWSNQLPALKDAGWRAIAIDVKGFGNSDAPKDIGAYRIDALTGDFVSLLDALNIEKAIFCGHDWGGALVWHMAQLHPGRVAGVIGVCTPLKKRAPVPPLDIIRKRATDRHYFIEFQEPGVAEEKFSGKEEFFFRMMFQKPVPKEIWPQLIPRVYDIFGRFDHGAEPGPERAIVSDEIISIYADAYRTSGFHGGINLYRNINANWEYFDGRDQTVRAPSLWIGAELDLFLPPEHGDDLDELVPDIEKKIIPGCGHWMMWEKPTELNAELTDWLSRRFSN